MPYYINPNQIRQLVSESVYQKGITYSKQGRVKNLTYDKEINRWFATVETSEDKDFDVQIVYRDENKVSVYCNCSEKETYGQCKHIVAVMLEIYNKEQELERKKKLEEFKLEEEFKQTNRIIHIFASNEDDIEPTTYQQDVREPLQIEFICKVDHSAMFYTEQLIMLELKVGPKRTYVVKDIRGFLEAVEEERPFPFTSKFAYDPTDYYFNEEDMEVIKLLIGIYNNEQAYRKSLVTWNRMEDSQTSNRNLLIPPSIIKTILPLLKQRQTTIEVNNQEYLSFELKDNDTPIRFHLEQGASNTFQLDLGWLQEATFLEAYGYLFHNGIFYRLSNHQRKMLKEIFPISYMARKQSLTISSEQMEEFISHVVPGLKKIGKLTISDNVSENIKNPPLYAKLWIDYQHNRLLTKLEYHYDDMVVNPFRKEENLTERQDYFLMRDTEKERKIMNVFEKADFKFNGQQLYIEHEDLIFEFLFYLLPELEKNADVYMTDEANTLLSRTDFVPKPVIELDTSMNLLEVHFDMKGIEQEHIQRILNSVVEKKRYHRLPSGAFISLQDEDFQMVENLLNELHFTKGSFKEDRLYVPVARGMQVEELLRSKKDKAKFGKAFRALLHHIKNPEDLDFNFPKGVHAELRDYQKYGFQWLKTLAYYHLGGILADDMGLGKTLQSITYIVSEKESNPDRNNPSLIIAPASLIYNWKHEFEKFAPGLKVSVIAGNREERQALLDSKPDTDVWITSYPLIRQDIDSYMDSQFDILILDEAQAIKNHLTKTAKAVKKIKAGNRFALSGTPIENRLDELWSIFDAVLPGLFPSLESFRNLPQEKVAQISRPFILRRLKKEVLKELPDKIETVQTSELTKEQKELYVAYLTRIQQETIHSIEEEGFGKSKLKILAGLTRLRQLCCHPSLFIEDYQGRSAKLEQLVEVVQQSIENDNRILIFSQFSSMLKLIRNTFEEYGYEYFYLDGNTPSEERVSMASRFNHGEKQVFLISLKAGGTGLNLTGADTVILYDLWWNPAVEQQAADRAHRIGQKKVVQVIRLITEGTIEEKIFELQQQKKELVDKVIQPGETMLSSLTEDDIRDLLMIGNEV